VLQALMVLDQPLDDEVEVDEKNDELGRLHIHQLLQMVLQDAQTRLFFKAQAVIQSEIRYYVPTVQDLAYPNKLIGAFPLSLICIFLNVWRSCPRSTNRV
jgi:conserved oligomeric Golgi complex subunit 3